jgi:predicted transcriptional regulator YdeE
MTILERSEEITGYKTYVVHRPAFTITGYTLIVPAHADRELIPQFWSDVLGDGRLEALKGASRVPAWVLGLGSWDAACEKHGQRYTLCIEATQHTDFTALARRQALFTMEIGESDWLCFKLTQAKYDARFWRDNPYKMMKPLGYQFNMDAPNVGLHFDAYPPGCDEAHQPEMEFWITVKK